jgi:hypothetical protein
MPAVNCRSKRNAASFSRLIGAARIDLVILRLQDNARGVALASVELEGSVEIGRYNCR